MDGTRLELDSTAVAGIAALPARFYQIGHIPRIIVDLDDVEIWVIYVDSADSTSHCPIG